jgi:hypothetical protein
LTTGRLLAAPTLLSKLNFRLFILGSCCFTKEGNETTAQIQTRPPPPLLPFGKLQKRMAASCAGVRSGRLIIALVVAFLLVILSSSFPASSAAASATAGAGNGGARAAFRSGEETLRWERIEAQLARVRNASVKTIQVRCAAARSTQSTASSFVSVVAFLLSSGASLQSPDGDVIDCVPTHLQPAFQHPKLRGLRPEVRCLQFFSDERADDAGDGEPENAQRVVYVLICRVSLQRGRGLVTLTRVTARSRRGRAPASRARRGR